MQKSSKNYSNVNKNDAFKMYVEENLTIPEVAEKIGMSDSTIRKWATKDNWAAKKKEIREKAQTTVINKIARDMAKVDIDIKENFCNVLFDKFEDIENIKKLKADIQNMKAKDIQEAVSKTNAISNLALSETKIIDSITKIFDRLERRYLPHDANTDNDIKICITSGGREINFLGMRNAD